MHENNPSDQTQQNLAATVTSVSQHEAGAEIPVDNQFAASFLTLPHGQGEHQQQQQQYAMSGAVPDHPEDINMQESQTQAQQQHLHDQSQLHDEQQAVRPPREAVQIKSNIFSGLTVTWSGKFTYPREELRRKIEEHGGICVDNVSKKVNYVLTTADLAQKPVTSRLQQALKYNIPIIDEQYIHECVQAGIRLDVSKYILNIQLPQEHHSPTQQLDPAMVAAQATANANALQEHMPNEQHLRQALQQMMNTHAQPLDGMGEAQQMLNMPGTPPLSSNTSGTSPGLDMSDSSKLQIKMFVKGSRQTVFSEQFPEILYTLTWKHKYDIRIVANKKIFKGEQNKLMEAFTMMLVLAKNNEIPIYDEDKEVKRRRKRQKIAKRKQKKPTDTDTITISSLHKAAENEVIIRFGINSTFCSKRFNYSAFRLYINYAPQDLPDDYHFTIYSAEFKTFVKKNANITKYLHYPKQLNPTTTIITKETTTRLKTKYAQVTKHDSGSSFGSPAVPRKGQRKRKRNDYGEEGYDEEEESQMIEEQQYQGDMGGQDNLINMIYPLFLQQQQAAAMGGQAAMGMPYGAPMATMAKNYTIQEKGIAWFGDPIGMNINGDFFYMAFCKDGALYKINDFVYLAPEESGNENQQDTILNPDGSNMNEATQADLSVAPNPQQISNIEANAAMVAAESVIPQQIAQEPQSNAFDQSQQQQQQQEQPPVQQSMMEHDSIEQQPSVPQDPIMQHDDGIQKSDAPITEDDDDFEFDASSSSAPESYWICKIINLVQTKAEGMKLIGQWFYRWCDVQSFGYNIDVIAKDKPKKHFLFQKEKEVFVSFDLNYNSLSTVRGKCFVKFMEPEIIKKNRKSLLKPHRYYFSQGYNRLRSEFIELPEQMLKIMKETTNDDEDADPLATLQQQMMAHHSQMAAALSMPVNNQQMAQMAQMGMVPGMAPGMGMGMGMGMGGMADASGVNTADWNAISAMQQMAPQDSMHPDEMHQAHHHQ